MGFYLRKSIRVGPFRFNLSKSGIGVSAGVRGFRVGMGPRGNYVHMGVGGIYYRATLPSSGEDPGPTLRQIQNRAARAIPTPIPDNTHDPLTEIESGDVMKMVDSSSRELLDELNSKQRAVRVGPIALVVVLVAAVYAYKTAWPLWAIILLALASVALIVAAYVWDTLRKSVVLFYNFDSTMEKAYALLHQAAQQLAACSGVWHIESAGRVRDRKYHAGAGTLVKRRRTGIGPAAPPFVKTNIATISLNVGRQTLHFFPDRVLIYDRSGVGAVSYQDLCLDVRPKQFIEDGSAPHDATVVGQTWRFVNKSGGPDKRFKDNVQLPICLYEEVSLSSASGLNEVVQFSRAGVAKGFSGVVTMLARAIPNERALSKSPILRT